jgi:hypothetical protein
MIFFSVDLHNEIKSFYPALGHPIPKILLQQYWLIRHSHATVASHGTTMVMGFKDI